MSRVNIKIRKKIFNKVYLDLLEDKHRYLVLYGGAGSGKSVFAVERYLVKLLKEQGCNLLVARAVGKTNRDSTFALFKQMISVMKLGRFFTIKESDMRIVCIPNGNEVLFKGIDDSEKLKSITFSHGVLSDIWIEEASEISQADFNQLDIRLRGQTVQKQIVLTFNPIDAQHWLYRRFFDRKDDNARILKTTYKDNEHIDPEYASLLEGYKKTDPYYYEVYCLGNWGVAGQCFFDTARLMNIREGLPAQSKQGAFSYRYDGQHILGARFLEGDGMIRIYEPPQSGVPYVMGCDTAGEGEDKFAAQLLDNITGKQVAVLWGSCDEDEFVRQIACLGQYYNNALIAVEVNFSTHAVRELVRLGYGRIYMRESFDSVANRKKTSLGFVTNARTRPLLLAQIKQYIAEQGEMLCDRETVGELMTFVRNGEGRAEAKYRAHDDLVMALGIALLARESQRRFVKHKREKTDEIESFLCYDGEENGYF